MDHYSVRLTTEASEDLIRLYQFILDRDKENWLLAEEALDAIKIAIRQLGLFPYNCRKAEANNPYLRELIIPFGNTGYVALFEIEPEHIITILAFRHQREDDYH